MIWERSVSPASRQTSDISSWTVIWDTAHHISVNCAFLWVKWSHLLDKNNGGPISWRRGKIFVKQQNRNWFYPHFSYNFTNILPLLDLIGPPLFLSNKWDHLTPRKAQFTLKWWTVSQITVQEDTSEVSREAGLALFSDIISVFKEIPSIAWVSQCFIYAAMVFLFFPSHSCTVN